MKVLVRPDEALEAEIDEALAAFNAASDETEQRAHWSRMVALLGKRSPIKVRRMEVAQGLNKRATFVPREEARKT